MREEEEQQEARIGIKTHLDQRSNLQVSQRSRVTMVDLKVIVCFMKSQKEC